MTKHQQAAIRQAAAYLHNVPDTSILSVEQFAGISGIPVEELRAGADIIAQIRRALENGRFEITTDGRLIVEPLALDWGGDEEDDS